MNDTNDSNIDRDHMGDAVEGALADLEDVLKECYGKSGIEVEGEEDNGQIDNLIDHCEIYLKDVGDGIKDRDGKHLTWRPLKGNALFTEAISAHTERFSGNSRIATESEVVSVEPVAAAQAPPFKSQAPSTAPEEEYYIRRGNKVMGPISDVKIREGIWNGKVEPTDQLGSDKSGPWQVLSTSDFSTCFQT